MEFFSGMPCSLKNDSAQVILNFFAKISDVKSALVGLAQGHAGSDKYTTIYHCDIYLFFFNKRNENSPCEKEIDFQTIRKYSLFQVLECIRFIFFQNIFFVRNTMLRNYFSQH